MKQLHFALIDYDCVGGGPSFRRLASPRTLLLWQNKFNDTKIIQNNNKI